MLQIHQIVNGRTPSYLCKRVLQIHQIVNRTPSYLCKRVLQIHQIVICVKECYKYIK